MALPVRSRGAVVAAASVVVVLTVAAALVIAARVNSSTRSGARPAHAHPQWIISNRAVAQLRDAGADTSLVRKAFGDHSAYVIDNSRSPSVGLPTATYGSYRAIQHALATGALPGGYKAVIYDNEAWAETPAAEQRNPAEYEQLVASLLHKHGLLFIATPGVDLVRVLNPGTPGPDQLRAYLSDGIAADAARYADVIDIQAQRAETEPSAYASFVTAAAAQARKANPHVIVLAGLRSGLFVTLAELFAAYSSVKSIVHGYWLNIPGSGARCPSCGSPDPRPALELLRRIYG